MRLPDGALTFTSEDGTIVVPIAQLGCNSVPGQAEATDDQPLPRVTVRIGSEVGSRDSEARVSISSPAASELSPKQAHAPAWDLLTVAEHAEQLGARSEP